MSDMAVKVLIILSNVNNIILLYSHTHSILILYYNAKITKSNVMWQIIIQSNVHVVNLFFILVEI